MNQKKMAVQVGISPAHLNRILKGKSSASKRLALTLAGATGIPAAVWILGSPEERTTAWSRFVAATRQQ